MQDPQSLHKYLYAHGDPASFIDPSGASIRVTISLGIGALIAGLGVTASLYYAKSQGRTLSQLWLIRKQGSILQSTDGTWDGNRYLPTVMYDFNVADDAVAKCGCVGLVGLRLGAAGFRPWDQIGGTKAFMDYEDAEDLYESMKAAGGTPWLYAVQMDPALPAPVVVDPATSSEVGIGSIPQFPGGNFNFSSRLFLRDGKKTWESIDNGKPSIFQLQVSRHEFLYTDVYGYEPRNVYFVSPRHSGRFVDESE